MNQTTGEILQALQVRREAALAVPLRRRFADDPERFARYSLSAQGLFLDYSKNLIDGTTHDLLFELAMAAKVTERRTAMFAGDPINETEARSVLHVALRAEADEIYRVQETNVVPGVHRVLKRMAEFADGVRSGAMSGSGGAITDVVNIGIGGSDLGPAMAVRALRPYHDGPRLHFVSNVDGAHIRDTLADLDPGHTLFLIASKTFTTIETMTNAATARRWVVEALGEQAVATHFAAISTALNEVESFGIDAGRVFEFWDWVGGRYSIWSAIGLPLMIAIGAENFAGLLAGGRSIDAHFRDAPLSRNLPVVMALVGVWYRNVIGCPVQAVLPYDQRLERFPAYLQQLDMESNGKRVGLDGEAVEAATGPIVFGEPGTNGQHAFYQLLHQGTDVVPCDFLLAARSDVDRLRHHDLLVANCLAQSQALMKGRTIEEARADLIAANLSPDQVERLAPHKVFPGNRPSNTIIYQQLDPVTLGKLIALYEHKIFVQGVIWGINSFDQWGVELGKELAGELLPMVQGTEPTGDMDSSTTGLLATVARFRQ